MVAPRQDRQHPPTLTRRGVLPLVLGSASGLYLPKETRADDIAPVSRSDNYLGNVRSPVVPGLSASLRPVIIGAEGSSPPSLITDLGKSRIGASDLSPLSQSLNPLADNEMYYPSFIFGAWNVSATLRRKIYPYGIEYVPSSSLIEGSPRYRFESIGDSTSYEAHYYSTISNDDTDIANVNLRLGARKAKIINDRAFNAMSVSKAYKQMTRVQEVDWDPRKDPTHVTLLFGAGPLTEDMMPLGKRKAEVYITARRSQSGVNEISGAETFCAAETARQVTRAAGNVIVSDTETITEFQLENGSSEKQEGDIVKATSRIAVYLTPNPNSREGVLWEQVRGKAVAFFDYDIIMKRKYEEIPRSGEEVRACVRTPKDFVQCK